MRGRKYCRYDYHHPKKEGQLACLMDSAFVAGVAGALVLTMPIWMILLGII